MKISSTSKFAKTLLLACLASGTASLIACSSGEEGEETTGLSMGQQQAARETEPRQASALNESPEIRSVEFRPSAPRAGERLTAVVSSFDPDGDPIKYEFQWSVDGVGVSNGGAELMLRNVSKGSRIEVSVTASDPHSSSQSWEAEVTVENRPPILQGVVFEPLGEVSTAHDVTAVPRSYDPDHDKVEYEYIWKVNGSVVAEGTDKLERRSFRRGDKIVLEVVAFDGDDRSEPLISAPVPVVNAAPKITSAPSGFDGERFRYAIKVDDADGDRLFRFFLLQGPKGMSLDSMSGVATWTPGSDQEGDFPVEISVEDRAGGSDSQRFNLSFGYEDSATSPASPSR